MEFFEEIESIKKLLRQDGYGYLADDILDRQLSGGTGGEVLILVCSRLLGIKEIYPKAYKTIALKADGLIDYCRSTGLYPNPSYPERHI